MGIRIGFAHLGAILITSITFIVASSAEGHLINIVAEYCLAAILLNLITLGLNHIFRIGRLWSLLSLRFQYGPFDLRQTAFLSGRRLSGVCRQRCELSEVDFGYEVLLAKSVLTDPAANAVSGHFIAILIPCGIYSMIFGAHVHGVRASRREN